MLIYANRAAGFPSVIAASAPRNPSLISAFIDPARSAGEVPAPKASAAPLAQASTLSLLTGLLNFQQSDYMTSSERTLGPLNDPTFTHRSPDAGRLMGGRGDPKQRHVSVTSGPDGEGDARTLGQLDLAASAATIMETFGANGQLSLADVERRFGEGALSTRPSGRTGRP